MRARKHFFCDGFLLMILLVSSPVTAWVSAAQEVRGLWVDTFHPAMRNSNEVAQLLQVHDDVSYRKGIELNEFSIGR